MVGRRRSPARAALTRAGAPCAGRGERQGSRRGIAFVASREGALSPADRSAASPWGRDRPPQAWTGIPPTRRILPARSSAPWTDRIGGVSVARWRAVSRLTNASQIREPNQGPRIPRRRDEPRSRERGRPFGSGLSAGSARQLSGIRRIARSRGVLLSAEQGRKAVCQRPSRDFVWPITALEGE